VTIDRTGLGKRKNINTIKVSQIIGSELIQEVNIEVYLNGIWIDSKYVNIVRIGTQVWMGENLNVGTRIDGSQSQTDNGITEKYCYNDINLNCDIYGGMYTWHEMMNYNPSDSGNIGTTQGICPDGWHIPTINEWNKLVDTILGSHFVAGGKLKETGTVHWVSPNEGATNETGFTALPGGEMGRDDIYNPNPFDNIFGGLGTVANFWSSTIVFEYPEVKEKCCMEYWISNSGTGIGPGFQPFFFAESLRCIKDP
jgi:uncharacterized protein (TIGR02145 family)